MKLCHVRRFVLCSIFMKLRRLLYFKDIRSRLRVLSLSSICAPNYVIGGKMLDNLLRHFSSLDFSTYFSKSYFCRSAAVVTVCEVVFIHHCIQSCIRQNLFCRCESKILRKGVEHTQSKPRRGFGGPPPRKFEF